MFKPALSFAATLIALAGPLLGSPNTEAANPLGFERVLGQVSVEGMAISNQFARAYGMSFRFADGGFPIIARKGYPAAAWGSAAGEDTLRSANAAVFGEGFLGRQTGGSYAYVIDFAQPVSFVSGYAIDVDESAGVTITAYSDDGTNALTQIIVRRSSVDAGDGLPAPWELKTNGRLIRQVRLASVNRIALDNLDSDFVPEPPQAPQVSAAWGLLLHGEVGRIYQVQFKNDANDPAWTPLADLELPSPSYLFRDPEAAQVPHRIYRVLAMP